MQGIKLLCWLLKEITENVSALLGQLDASFEELAVGEWCTMRCGTGAGLAQIKYAVVFFTLLDEANT